MSEKKKPSLFQKLFGGKKDKDKKHKSCDSPPPPAKDTNASAAASATQNSHKSPSSKRPPSELKIQTQTSSSSSGGKPTPTRLSPPAPTDGGLLQPPSSPKKSPTSQQPPAPTSSAPPTKPKPRTGSSSGTKKKGAKHRKRGATKGSGGAVSGAAAAAIRSGRPLEYPATPEMIMAFHQAKPFLDRNEEWLLVELNEYECLVDSLEVIRTIAKHSKFFEVEPDELWEEFFEFVDEIPSYDEVVNLDIWQEFRDNKYPC